MKVATTLTFALLVALAHRHRCQDISFPHDDEDSEDYVSGSGKILRRKPLKIVDRCPTNMLLYPGDSYRSSWVCDCRTLHVYFPKIDNCFKVFSRGPCPERHYVYLPLNETVPICAPNPCLQANHVLYEGYCYELGAPGSPCSQDELLSIDKTTYQLHCQRREAS